MIRTWLARFVSGGVRLRRLRGPARSVLGGVAIALSATAARPAAQDPGAPLVAKLISTNRRLRIEAEGSGYVYRRGERVFVLTAEHVGYHSNRTAYHQILFDSRASADVEYVNSEWSNGLALFRAVSPEPWLLERARPLECGPAPLAADRLWVGGFPSRSRALSWSDEGHVSNPRATREDLLDVRVQLEVSNAGVEYGMSGGPAFALGADGTLGAVPQLVGVLSTKKSEREDVAWAIPCAVAVEWAALAEDPSFKPKYFRFEGSQRHVEAGSLLLRFDEFEGRRRLEIRRATDDDPSNTREPELAALRTIQEVADRAHRASRFSYPHADIIGFAPAGELRDPRQYGYWRATGPSNLVDAIRKLGNSAFRPIAVIQRQGDQPFFHLGHRLIGMIRGIEFTFGYGHPIGERIRGLMWIANELNQIERTNPEYALGYLKRSDLQEILTSPRFEDSWRRLREDRPNDERVIRKTLEEILDQVRDYVI